MEKRALSIRPFLGSKDFDLSRRFYTDLGFEEVQLGPQMSLFKTSHIAFYLQNAYVQDWVDNTMVFVEVNDVEAFWKELVALDLISTYPTAKLKPIRYDSWGNECFVHDPAGNLWHFGQFNKA